LGFLDVGHNDGYFDDHLNSEIISRVSDNCYLPVNEKLCQLIERYPGIKLCFSLSGVVIDQLERYKPKALRSFKQLAQTGSVEFLSETYYHSLSSLTPNEEFIIQVNAHRQSMEHHFGVYPEVSGTRSLFTATVSDRRWPSSVSEALYAMASGAHYREEVHTNCLGIQRRRTLTFC